MAFSSIKSFEWIFFKYNFTKLVISFILVIFFFTSIISSIKVKAQNNRIFVKETFSSQTTSGWGWGKSAVSEPPCLTGAPKGSSVAGSIPGCVMNTTNANLIPESNGVLRLTSAKNNQATFVYYDTPLPSNRGLTFTFEVYAYGSGNINNDADGFSFILFDGEVTPTTGGGYGGSLGYAKRGGFNGFEGGYIGIGFDSYGNFANDGEGRGDRCVRRSPYSGLIKNNITLRGSGNGNNGYCYITGTNSLTNVPNHGRISFPLERTRSLSIKRKLRVNISSTNIINVSVDFGSGYQNVITNYNLNTVLDQDPLPPSLKFGFAGSTGGQYNIHEVDSMEVVTTPPDLSATTTLSSGSLQNQNSTADLTVQVSNNLSAGFTNSVTEVNISFPAGISPIEANGQNWNTQLSSSEVDATYSQPISPGQILPELTIRVQIDDPPDDPITTVTVKNQDEVDSKVLSNNINTFSPQNGNTYSALTRTLTDCSSGAGDDQVVTDSGTSVLQVCVEAGNITIYPGDSIDNNDICTRQDVNDNIIKEAIDSTYQPVLVQCDQSQVSASLSPLAVSRERGNTTAIINDIIFEDLRGLHRVNYSLTATINDLTTPSGRKISLGSSPDGLNSDYDIDSPQGSNNGKIFAHLDCSSSDISVLAPFISREAGIENYSRGSAVSVVSQLSPFTIIYTTDAVIPSRVDVDECFLKYRIPAYAQAGDYTTSMIYTII